MSTKTTNLGLTMPELDEQYQLNVWNGNSGIIDDFAGEVNAALVGKASADDLTAETAARKASDANISRITAAQIEQIDTGAKNLLTVSRGNNTTAQRFVDVPCTAKAGTYVLYFGHLESNDTDSTTCSVSFKDASSVDVASPAEYQFQRGDGVYKVITLKNDNLAKIRIYGANNYATSAGDVVTFSEAMFCTKSAWDISQAYVPYCPTAQEMYQMILALQNGG